MYPPALCAAILRGIAAQRSRDGRAVPAHLERSVGAREALPPEVAQPGVLAKILRDLCRTRAAPAGSSARGDAREPRVRQRTGER
eukprot:10233206-Alexandrium_andersonii.AAC.1